MSQYPEYNERLEQRGVACVVRITETFLFPFSLQRNRNQQQKRYEKHSAFSKRVLGSFTPTTCFLFVSSTRRSYYNIRFAWTRSFDKLISAIISHALVNNNVYLSRACLLDAFDSYELFRDNMLSYAFSLLSVERLVNKQSGGEHTQFK